MNNADRNIRKPLNVRRSGSAPQSSLRATLAMAALLTLSGLAAFPGAARSQSGFKWRQVSIEGMGFVDGLIVHPNTKSAPNLIYARTDVGGAYRWDPEHKVWLPLLDWLSRTEAGYQSVESIALDPTNPDKVYIAGGDKDREKGGSGILKSSDRGNTWTRTSFPQSVKIWGNQWWRYTGERLAVDPKNGSILYFGSREDGLWRSLDEGGSWNQVSSFTEKGDNGGRDAPGGLTFVVFDSTKSAGGKTQRLYVGVMGKGVMASTDGGRTWSALKGPGSNKLPMRAAVASDGTLYVTYHDMGYGNNGAVYRFPPSGGDGKEITPPSNLTYGPRNYVGVTVHPTNPNYAIVGSEDMTPRDIFLTENGGADWTIVTNDPGGASAFPANRYRRMLFEIPSWYPNTYPTKGNPALTHAFSWSAALVLDPNDPKRLWVTTGYGVYKTEDITAGPVRLQVTMKGLEELCVQQLISPPKPNPHVLLSLVMDMVGYAHESLGQPPSQRAASSDFLGVGNSIAISEKYPSRVAIVGAYPGNPVGKPQGRLSSDGGKTWGNFPSNFARATAGNIAISASKPDVMIWAPLSPVDGQNQVPHRTTDGGKSWSPVGSLPSNGAPFSDPWLHSQALESDKVNGDKFYFYHSTRTHGFDENRFLRSTDGGASFQEACKGCLPNFNRVFVKAAPGMEGEVWVAFNDYYNPPEAKMSNRRLYRSSNGGSFFSPVAGLDSCFNFAWGASMPPSTKPTAFVYGYKGGVEGIYRSTDMGGTWTLLGKAGDLPVSIVASLEGDKRVPGAVFVGTGCRGIFYYGPAFTTAVGTVDNMDSSVEAGSRQGRTEGRMFLRSVSGGWVLEGIGQGLVEIFDYRGKVLGRFRFEGETLSLPVIRKTSGPVLIRHRNERGETQTMILSPSLF